MPQLRVSGVFILAGVFLIGLVAGAAPGDQRPSPQRGDRKAGTVSGDSRGDSRTSFSQRHVPVGRGFRKYNAEKGFGFGGGRGYGGFGYGR